MAKPLQHISIDFSSGGITAVGLEDTELVFFSYLLPEIKPTDFTYQSRFKEIIPSIRKALKKIEFPVPYVSFTLPQSLFLTQLVEIPIVKEAEIPEAIYWKMESLLPDELDSYNKDFIIIASDKKNNKYYVLTFAIKRNMVNTMVALFERIGLTPVLLEPPSMSLFRFINNFYSKHTGAFLNIGVNETNMGLYTTDTLLYSQEVPKGLNLVIEKLKQLYASRTQNSQTTTKTHDQENADNPQNRQDTSTQAGALEQQTNPHNTIRINTEELTKLTKEVAMPIYNEFIRLHAFIEQSTNTKHKLEKIYICPQNLNAYKLIANIFPNYFKQLAEPVLIQPAELIKLPKDFDKKLLTPKSAIALGLNLYEPV